MNGTKPGNLIFILILALSVVVYFVFIMRGSVVIDGHRYFTLFDDAMISMRFAKNAAHGFGFVWNKGEMPVEGFTNALWTFWMAILHVVPIGESLTPLLLASSSALCLLATTIGVFRLTRTMKLRVAAQSAAAAMVAFCYPLMFWSLRGMETGLIAASLIWLIVCVAASLKTRSWAPVGWACALTMALIFTRQETIVPVAACLLYLFVASPTRNARLYVPIGLATAAAIALLTIWRYWEYGELLPNTYYLKIVGVGILERVRRGILTLQQPAYLSIFPIGVIFACYLLLIVTRLSEATRAIVGSSIGIVAAQIAYSVWAGGDAFEWSGVPNRFVVVVLPLLILFEVFAIETAIDAVLGTTQAGARMAGSSLALPMAAVVIWATANALPVIDWVHEGATYVKYDKAATETALCLRQNTPANARMGITWAGTIPYWLDRPFVDLLGKMDKKIARMEPRGPFLPGHNKWDYEHSIRDERANYILQLWGSTASIDEELSILADQRFTEIGQAWPCYRFGFLIRSFVLEK